MTRHGKVTYKMYHGKVGLTPMVVSRDSIPVLCCGHCVGACKSAFTRNSVILGPKNKKNVQKKLCKKVANPKKKNRVNDPFLVVLWAKTSKVAS